jgi:hypothetical protein
MTLSFECLYAEFRSYLNVKLSVVMLIVAMPSDVMMNVVMLSVVVPRGSHQDALFADIVRT